MTLDEALDRFCRGMAARNYAPATRVAYREHLRTFLKWLGPGAGQREARSITRQDIVRYQEHLVSQGRKKSTQAARVRGLKRLFEWLVEQGHLFQSPTDRIVETPVGSKSLPEVMTHEEVARLLEIPNVSTWIGVRDRAILELLYATGLRKSELLALDVADVDLEGLTVRVRAGKGRKGRVVPFGSEAKRWLREYVRDVRPRRQAKRPQERAFFLNRTGRRLSGERTWQIVSEAAREAGIRKRVTVHSLRHAFATHMLAGGASITTIQKLLGHADPTITSQVYARVYPADLKREHDRTHPREKPSAAKEEDE